MGAFSFPNRYTVRQTLVLGTLAGLVSLTTYCASQSEELNIEGRTLCPVLTTFVNDTKAFANTANSLHEALNTFVWVYRGGPLREYRAYINANTQAGRLEQRLDAFLREKGAKLNIPYGQRRTGQTRKVEQRQAAVSEH